MHGFFKLASVAEFTAMLQCFSPLAAEEISLEEADRRVLAADVIAGEDLPPANRSSMDGYAVRAADLFGASETNPGYLTVAGNIAIEQPPDFSLQPGECASIVTGGVLPQGADAVLMVEHTHEMAADEIEARKAVAPGENVMLQGEDAAAGASALTAGTRLRPQEIGLLAALGYTRLQATRRPRAGVVSTGDELVAVEETPQLGQVRDVNGPALACLARRAGAVCTGYGRVPDQEAPLQEVLQLMLAENDVVFLSGGSSVGARDYTLAAVEAMKGAKVLAHGVAVSPGKPCILARVPGPGGDRAVIGLPGQVTSAQVVMHVFMQPFLRWLMGDARAFDPAARPVRPAVLARNIASKPGREDYVRVKLQQIEDGWKAAPMLGKSGLLRTLVDADGLVRIPAAAEGLEAGTEVDVQLFT